MNITENFKVKTLILLCFVSVINNMASMAIVMGVGRLAFDIGAGALATLPIAVNYTSIMLGSIPVSYLLIRMGIRWGLFTINLLSAIAAFGIVLSVQFESFALLLISLVLMGMTLAAMHQMRYLATDAVSEKYKPLAMSFILSMPILGGLVFPALVHYMQETFGTAHRLSEYNMLFMAQLLLTLLVVLVLLIFKLDINYKPETNKINFSVIKKPGIKQAIIITAFGYSAMTFLMTATPLFMGSEGFHLHHSNTLIGYHVVGMSLPSLFIAYIIMKFSINTTVKFGILIYFGVFVFNVFGGNTYFSLMMGLILLGVGWCAVYSGGSNYITKLLTPEERMTAQGVTDTFVFMGTGVAGLFAGITMYYIDWVGTNIVLLIILIIIGIANYQLRNAEK